MFEFDELTFVVSDDVDDAEMEPYYLSRVRALRPFYPELAGWSNAGFIFAWQDYSQALWALGWLDAEEKMMDFLAFCYLRQRCPGANFGNAGQYSMLFDELARQLPWLENTLPPLPRWAAD